MSNREKNLLIAAVVLAVITLPWWPIWGESSNVDSLGLTADSNDRFESLRRLRVDMPSLQIDELEREKAPFSGTTRNLFEYGEAQQEEVVEEVYEDDFIEDEDPLMIDSSITDDVETAQPRITQPRLSGYECIGVFNNNESKYVVIHWRDQVFVAKEGDIVNTAFRIDSINQQGIEIFVLDGEYTQSLRLKAPAGSEGA